jgi:peptidoglycan/LPS O-acetylase OafA/YrhL
MTESAVPMRRAAAETHIDALQSLRGIAATMVVAVHCIACWIPLMERESVAALISDALLVPISGRAPVIVFFVLSGFVLAESLKRRTQYQNWAVEFYVQRLFRILPASWVALGLMAIAVFASISYFDARPDVRISDFMLGPLTATALGFVRTALQITNEWNPAYWTLHVELVGSLLMPVWLAILLAVDRKRQLLVTALFVVIGLALPFVPLKYAPVSHMANMFVFCFPLGIAVSVSRGSFDWLRLKWVGFLAATVLLLAHNVFNAKSPLSSWLGTAESLVFVMGPGANVALFLQHIVEAAASAVLIAYIVRQGDRTSILNTGALKFLGAISYSLYLVHLPVLTAFIAVVLHISPEPGVALTRALPFITFAFIMPLTVAISTFMYRAVELPGIAAGKNLMLTIRGRTALRRQGQGG